MLYSTKIKLNDKEYRVKFGIKELIKIQENGIDINDLESGIENVKGIMTILHTVIKDLEADFDTFVDMIDNSEHTIEDLSAILSEAIELGINKNKAKKN